MSSFPKYDDVGGFPLPLHVDKEAFDRFYWTAYSALVKETDIFENRGISNYFIQPLLESYKWKVKAGVEVANFPQLMDMYNQFLKPIGDYTTQPELIDEKKAIIPEVKVIERFAKEEYEKTNNRLQLKLCITGPIDLYVKKHGFSVYKDLALNFSESIRRFIKNSLIKTKYLDVNLVSIDEPSFGFVDIMGVNNDDLIDIYDKCLEGLDITSQIHLHTLQRADIPLQTKNIDCLTCEYASDRSNKIPKKELDTHDKFIRVGITRTRIDYIIGEFMEQGKTWEELKTLEGTLSLIDPKVQIKKRLEEAFNMYGDRLKYTGPDCGVKGWAPPEVAYELLRRTGEVIAEFKKESIT